MTVNKKQFKSNEMEIIISQKNSHSILYIKNKNFHTYKSTTWLNVVKTIVQ